MGKINKINSNQKTPIVLAVLLMIIGVMTISVAIMGYYNLTRVLKINFGLITIFNIVSFIITHKDKDIESLLTFLASGLIVALLHFLDLREFVNVGMILLIWVAFISLIRVKKADYYDDRKNKAWIIQMISIAIFILTGVLTSVSVMLFASKVQIIIFGYFFLINGILELIDPLALQLGKLNENRK